MTNCMSTPDKRMIAKYRRIEEKYFSKILNLNSASKEWRGASRALSRLRKTNTFKLALKHDNTF